ncbi:hypothetical protein [Paracraurococcus lichenis]|uniref:hypothetical protein n=1 Tax=Paracraurococcus lichenis TaxID=3064888 RepID=UPI0038D25468
MPTSAEQGYPGFRQEGIHGPFGWKGMPPELQARIAEEAAVVARKPATVERFRQAAQLVGRGATPASFAALLEEQRQRWAALAWEFGANAL